ncbi:hypothetical protein F5B17DRAFT_399661 [Nemania serpens]|nr:hypothetical protein F5B17DRAFT_399661 [Nemania serpens]
MENQTAQGHQMGQENESQENRAGQENHFKHPFSHHFDQISSKKVPVKTMENGNSATKTNMNGGHLHPGHLAKKRINDSGATYLRIYWHDYTSSARCRVIPASRIIQHYDERENDPDPDPFTVSVSKASLGLLPNDHMIPGVTGTGSYVLRPDWATLKSGPVPNHISCYADFHEEDGSAAALCPRGVLRRAVKHAATTAGLEFLVGFEVEFTLLQRTYDPTKKYQMIPHDGHAWSMARSLVILGPSGGASTLVVDDILHALQKAGIAVEQFHAEGAPGQYEVVLPPLPPLAACDALLHARQVIESVAARHEFRATLHPRPFLSELGTGSHAHLSITSENGDEPRVYERFYGGILAHFPAVFAFTNSHPASYERMVDGLWAGGRWVTWGSDNKETPLRKCRDSHWEVKVMDGMANPHLAIAALIYAGTEGAAEFTWGDCEIDPAKLSSEQRSALGIEKQFPPDLAKALEALQSDGAMARLLGAEVLERYVAVKTAEMELFYSIPRASRRMWVMERY